MLTQKIKAHKVLLLSIILIVCAALAMGTSVVMAGTNSENDIIEPDAVVKYDEDSGIVTIDGFDMSKADADVMIMNDDTLYKDALKDDKEGQEIAKKVCEKFGMDYNTIKLNDMTDEMIEYENSLWEAKYQK